MLIYGVVVVVAACVLVVVVVVDVVVTVLVFALVLVCVVVSLLLDGDHVGQTQQRIAFSRWQPILGDSTHSGTFP